MRMMPMMRYGRFSARSADRAGRSVCSLQRFWKRSFPSGRIPSGMSSSSREGRSAPPGRSCRSPPAIYSLPHRQREIPSSASAFSVPSRKSKYFPYNYMIPQKANNCNWFALIFHALFREAAAGDAVTGTSFPLWAFSPACPYFRQVLAGLIA